MLQLQVRATSAHKRSAEQPEIPGVMERLESHASDDALLPAAGPTAGTILALQMPRDVDPAALNSLPTTPACQQQLAPASKQPGPFDALSISPAFGSGPVLWVTLPDECLHQHLDQRAPARTAWELGILVHTARELDVPAICVILTWESRGASTYVIGVHATGMDWFNAHDPSAFTCDDCGGPCDDDDLGMEFNAGNQNCVRCTPCSLCTNCSVHIDHAKVCLLCSTDAEAKNLPESKQRRRRLVEEIATQREEFDRQL